MAATSPVSSHTHLSIAEALAPSNPRVLVAAHRGACQSAPENSIAALKEAIAQGADIVELDVRATADHVLVLLHDPTLERTSSGSGAVALQTYASVRSARLRRDSLDGHPASSDDGLPTLATALEVARNRILVNLDIKDDALAEHVVQTVIASGMSDHVFIKANIDGPADIARVRASAFFGRVAFVPMMQAYPGRFVQDLQRLEPLHCPMFEVAFFDIADVESGVDEIRRQNARLWVNTIECSHSLDFNDAHALSDPDAVWGRLIAAGVGAIQTDNVPELVAYLHRHQLRQDDSVRGV
jgi:glycerophosphoryl diester phosphodiesterase